MITIKDHKKLFSLLPDAKDSPVGEILTGVEGQYFKDCVEKLTYGIPRIR
jgi:hypothetical protein